MLTERFFRLAISAANSGVEVTLRELFSVLELGNELLTLERLRLTRLAVSKADLNIKPDLDIGDLDTVRLLSGSVAKIDGKSVLGEIAPGEGALVEFKQSAFFHWKRFQSQPSASTADLQSDDVTFALLKTIAAFSNSSGGRLYVGVKDDGSVCGIDRDFPYCKSQNEDGWQLKIRDLIKSKFHEGDTVNNYVGIDIASVSQLTIARISVSKRSKLSFLKGKDRHHLFCRQGNRTIEISIEDVEEFLLSRSS